MAATAGGYNIDNYLIPIDSTLRLYNVAGSNTNVLGVSPDAIGKIEVDGVTLTTNAQGAMTINLANSNTWTATQTFPIATYNNLLSNTNTWTATQTYTQPISTNSSQTVVGGPTTGDIVLTMPFVGSTYKKLVAYAIGYENDTTTAQTISFPASFMAIAAITFNNTGLTVTNSLTALTISSPNNTTNYTGLIIIEGY